MNAYAKKNGYELADGDKVILHGHRFTVRNPKIMKNLEGVDVLRFTGETDEAELKHTGYNGGCYGQTASLTYCVEVEAN